MRDAAPIAGDGLPDSRLFTFVDGPAEFALYFLEGQRLIRDLALLNAVQRDGFAYFRDAVLSVQPMIALTKRGEQFGFYLDSERPYFRLKIETAHHGDTRCGLVPDALGGFPAHVWGTARLLKLFPNNRPPYQSILRIDGLPLRSIVNSVLESSYQVHSAVIVSASSDQSAMLHQLPPLKGKEEWEYSREAVMDRRARIASDLDAIFGRALLEPREIVEAMGGIGFRYLADRPVRFRCTCSHERMVRNILGLVNVRQDELFDPGQAFLEVTCEYCKSQYRIVRDELLGGASPPN